MASLDALENRLSLGEQEWRLLNKLIATTVKWTKSENEKEQ